ncbi:Lrp/AsnC family transcriptional regulator [Haloarcula onubensis]|uniref:Winged helix-turn-helix transcriptional regulator n=1 Tax=Haloarcula onubensis TaxID=2950539 RepID=A0ABU2FS46_9EURY|nr:TrkA C-terminal domain-containing protein [Halomicroarcula sp. S3CR25-11]MDS0283578.1 winged helix-turn-helix transcriptional regulator [Halomicroarcula sp. S3CR25-11]
MGYRIDEIDERILYYLGDDARNTSAPTIAEEVDVTPATIRNRIRQLERHGIVRGYHADIDFEAAEGRLTTQFTCTAPVGDRSALANEALATGGVVDVRELLAGQRNLVVTAVGEDTEDINRIAQQLSALGLTIERDDIVRDASRGPYEPFAPEGDEFHSAVTDFQDVVGGAEVVEFTVSADADIAGRTLEGANAAGVLPDDVLVVSIERGDHNITPNGSTRIEAGDVVSIFSPGTFPERLIQAFETTESPSKR